jgi:hypothetical protein
MAIVVGTNSYITEAELATYAAARGVTLGGDPAVLLVKAMDYLAALEGQWQGIRTAVDQPLAWPRTPVYLYGQLVPDSAIPQQVKDAQAQLAIEVLTQPLQPTIAAGAKGSVISEKVDVIEVKYAEKPGGGNSLPVFTAVNALLKPLFRLQGGGSNFNVGVL